MIRPDGATSRAAREAADPRRPPVLTPSESSLPEGTASGAIPGASVSPGSKRLTRAVPPSLAPSGGSRHATGSYSL